jgi:hypothetical protein
MSMVSIPSSRSLRVIYRQVRGRQLRPESRLSVTNFAYHVGESPPRCLLL